MQDQSFVTTQDRPAFRGREAENCIMHIISKISKDADT